MIREVVSTIRSSGAAAAADHQTNSKVHHSHHPPPPPSSRDRCRPRRRPPRQIAATRASSRVGEPRRTSSSISTSTTSTTSTSSTRERRNLPDAAVSDAPDARLEPSRRAAPRQQQHMHQQQQHHHQQQHQRETVQCDSSAEALAERRAAPRTPRRGRSDERSVRRPRAASPAVSRESGAAACAQQPPRQRRAAATAAQLITAIGGFFHTHTHYPVLVLKCSSKKTLYFVVIRPAATLASPSRRLAALARRSLARSPDFLLPRDPPRRHPRLTLPPPRCPRSPLARPLARLSTSS